MAIATLAYNITTNITNILNTATGAAVAFPGHTVNDAVIVYNICGQYDLLHITMYATILGCYLAKWVIGWVRRRIKEGKLDPEKMDETTAENLLKMSEGLMDFVLIIILLLALFVGLYGWWWTWRL